MPGNKKMMPKMGMMDMLPGNATRRRFMHGGEVHMGHGGEMDKKAMKRGGAPEMMGHGGEPENGKKKKAMMRGGGEMDRKAMKRGGAGKKKKKKSKKRG